MSEQGLRLVAAHAGLLISSPEYNGLVTPLLKNTLDWCTRAEVNPFVGRVAAVVSASPAEDRSSRLRRMLLGQADAGSDEFICHLPADFWSGCVPSDLAAIVARTLADLAETAERARVKFDVQLPSARPNVMADGNLLKSSVWNLVQNGIQAMERHGGTLTVSVAPESSLEDAGRRLVLTVTDEGPGLDEGDLPRLFDPYFSKKEGGVGLGLAMVKRIAEEHGGRVTGENRTDGRPGAVFRISLPVAA